jgi:hypothetical protein
MGNKQINPKTPTNRTDATPSVRVEGVARVYRVGQGYEWHSLLGGAATLAVVGPPVNGLETTPHRFFLSAVRCHAVRWRLVPPREKAGRVRHLKKGAI